MPASTRVVDGPAACAAFFDGAFDLDGSNSLTFFDVTGLNETDVLAGGLPDEPF